jgi:hypothetical protein
MYFLSIGFIGIYSYCSPVEGGRDGFESAV